MSQTGTLRASETQIDLYPSMQLTPSLQVTPGCFWKSATAPLQIPM